MKHWVFCGVCSILEKSNFHLLSGIWPTSLKMTNTSAKEVNHYFGWKVKKHKSVSVAVIVEALARSQISVSDVLWNMQTPFTQRKNEGSGKSFEEVRSNCFGWMLMLSRLLLGSRSISKGSKKQVEFWRTNTQSPSTLDYRWLFNIIFSPNQLISWLQSVVH